MIVSALQLHGYIRPVIVRARETAGSRTTTTARTGEYCGVRTISNCTCHRNYTGTSTPPRFDLQVLAGGGLLSSWARFTLDR